MSRSGPGQIMADLGIQSEVIRSSTPHTSPRSKGPWPSLLGTSRRGLPGEVGDDAVGAAPGDAQAGRAAAVVCDAHQHRAWLVRKLQFALIKQSTIYSSNILL